MNIMKLSSVSFFFYFFLNQTSYCSKLLIDECVTYSARYKNLMLRREPSTKMIQPKQSIEEIKKVGIVGGGIAGLYSGLLIQRLNEEKGEEKKVKFKIFEANNRIGGRVYTYRFNGDPDQYFEAGAMRIPKTHKEVYSLIEYLNKKIENKYKGKQEKIDKYKINLIDYVLHHDNNYIYANGKKPITRKEARHEKFDYGYFDFKNEDGTPIKTNPSKMFNDAISNPRQELIEILKEDNQEKFDKFLKTYDNYSMRSYLLSQNKTHEEINYMEVMTAQTHQFNHSFVELLIEDIDFSNTHWKTIDQGMSRLPEACTKIIGRNNILLNTKVYKVENFKDKVRIYHSGSSKAEEFDRIILAVPPSVVRRLDRDLWPEKEEAIRSIYFEPLYKIGLRFQERFWEKDEKGSIGGQSTTDLSSRWIVYPSNGINAQEPGVLLCYSWEVML